MSGTAIFMSWLIQRQRHRRGAPLAGEHRRAQQELPGARRIRRDLAQFVEIAPPRFRIARFQAFLVGDRLLLHELDRHGAALTAVEIEQLAPAHRSRMTCASFSARLAASWMPPLRPMPPIGLLTWAASPASSTRPLRKVSATR